MSHLFKLSSLLNNEIRFDAAARDVGFKDAAEISSFLFGPYAAAVRKWKPADRFRGCMFSLNPVASSKAQLSTEELLAAAKANHGQQLCSISLNAPGQLDVLEQIPYPMKAMMRNGAWPTMIAQQVSKELGLCFIWANAVSAHVYIKGDLFLETPDVIGKLPAAHTGGFQALSWDDGEILFHFCGSNLNDTTRLGIWKLSKEGVLVPKPEELIRDRLGDFLKTRLAGYRSHQEEAHVENEGRADVSLHLIDDSILIVEIKWIGCALKSTRSGETDEAIKKAFIAKQDWFTRFDDRAIGSGVRQLATYFSTGIYHKAFLAVVDCTVPLAKQAIVLPDAADLAGHGPENFKILRGPVDPRTASVKAKGRVKP
jgi:hypothetical protein